MADHHTSLERDVALAPLTTLELGGPARCFLEATDTSALIDALRWARERDIDATVLGGGSNVVVADEGIDGLVVRLAMRGIDVRREGDRAYVTARAGEPWDPLVAEMVSQGLAGLECLAGIPGLAGATPIQNVGAYGQEVSETLSCVRVLDRRTLGVQELSPAQCELAYRDSLFKRHPDRWVVLEATFVLHAGAAPTIRYPELARALGNPHAPPPLTQVRDTVLALRRRKSMVLDAGDPNRRSAGSFFTNPVVDDEQAREVVERALAQGVVSEPTEVPRFEVGPGRIKLAAGWLIEHAGLSKGLRRGHVGISSNHALALVHHGGGTTAELLALAREVQRRVEARFGVRLRAEPMMLGFAEPPL